METYIPSFRHRSSFSQGGYRDVTIGKIAQGETIRGTIVASKMINGRITASGAISGTLDIGFIERGGGPPYEGEYAATSRPFEEYELQTEGKLMAKNVTVKKIPYFETSNTTDGITVYIGTTEVTTNG